MAPSRYTARKRVVRARELGAAAHVIGLAIGGLDYLVARGVRHFGGHRSGKVWTDDLTVPSLGYWVDSEPSETRAAHERRVDAKLQQILTPETAWDLGVSLPREHPFAA